MVKGSDKTYGELMHIARSQTGNQQVGETLEGVVKHIKENIIEYAVQANYENGITGHYYIHVLMRKEPYSNNALHLYPQCRRTRPSPYQTEDHYLWSVYDGGRVEFEWCIPSQEILGYILKHPNEFDKDYVRMLKRYVEDKLEKLEDYLVEGQIK